MYDWLEDWTTIHQAGEDPPPEPPPDTKPQGSVSKDDLEAPKE
ncbi:MAG TPA: hypothetical protein VLV83_17140 [Acidobacteriota bacterium]|nr:hypothetical protein [Acidobacteriota bacterium]